MIQSPLPSPDDPLYALRNDIEKLTNDVKSLASNTVRLPQNFIDMKFSQSIRNAPVQSVAMAVGAGILIGLILAR